LLVIGGSAGSLEVLLEVLPLLNTNLLFPVVLILHRRATQENTLIRLLASKTKLPVKEAEEKEVMQKGHIYIAPADYHLLIEKDHTFSLDCSEKINYSRPSIDVTFESAAEVMGEKLIAVLLSGANADGTNGLRAVKQYGGMTVVQDPDNAEVAYMPKSAIDAQLADHVLTAKQLIDFINRL